MTVNGTVLKHWSLASRALSAAETERYAVVTGAAGGLGMQPMMTDLGLRAGSCLDKLKRSQSVCFEVRTWRDTRHTELKYSWLQEVTRSGRVKMKRVPGEHNIWRTT